MISDRVLHLSKQPFMRPGQVDLDCQYACSVFDAKCRVFLEEEILKNPDKSVVVYNGWMGYVPNERSL